MNQRVLLHVSSFLFQQFIKRMRNDVMRKQSLWCSFPESKAPVQIRRNTPDFNSGTFYQTPNYSPTKLSRPPRTREVLENVTDQSSLRRNDWPVTCYLYSLSGILGEKKNA